MECPRGELFERLDRAVDADESLGAPDRAEVKRRLREALCWTGCQEQCAAMRELVNPNGVESERR